MSPSLESRFRDDDGRDGAGDTRNGEGEGARVEDDGLEDS